MLFSNFLSQLFIYLLKGMTEILNQAFKLSSGFLTFCHIYTCKSTNSRYVTGALRRVFRFVFWSGNAILEKGIQDTVGSGASSHGKKLRWRSRKGDLRHSEAKSVCYYVS